MSKKPLISKSQLKINPKSTLKGHFTPMKLYFTLIYGFLFCISANSQPIIEILAKNAYEIVTSRDSVNSFLIDGRSAEMYAEKHIEGSIHIDAFQDSLSVKLESYLQVQELIVYCTNSHRSNLISETLKELDYKGEVIIISDGINGWISAGFKTVGMSESH